jgi:hypothetical protein
LGTAHARDRRGARHARTWWPRRPISSPVKTRLLEILGLLVARPWHVSHYTSATLFRKIELHCPTLLLDEADTIFTRGGEVNETMREVLNAGNRRGAVVTRCVPRPVGAEGLLGLQRQGPGDDRQRVPP